MKRDTKLNITGFNFFTQVPLETILTNALLLHLQTFSAIHTWIRMTKGRHQLLTKVASKTVAADTTFLFLTANSTVETRF